ncbi:MAG: hypothetical protein LBG43_07670 [Treponema sp.]|jgi:hypothetical protein|nr:hypothetical protein [Treponema sp.]
MGTDRVRKARADIITNFLIFIAAFNLYLAVASGAINLAITIKAIASSGNKDILKEFGELYYSCRRKVVAAEAMVNDFVKNGYYSPNILNEQTLRQIADMGGGAANLDVRMSRFEDPPVNAGGWTDGRYTGNGAETAGDVMARNQAGAEESQRRRTPQAIKEGGVGQAMVILNSMQEVFGLSEKSAYYHNPGGGVTEYKPLTYDPFIKNENGKYEYLISLGSMIKTAVVIAQVISAKESVFYEEEESEGEKSGGFMEKTFEQPVR